MDRLATSKTLALKTAQDSKNIPIVLPVNCPMSGPDMTAGSCHSLLRCSIHYNRMLAAPQMLHQDLLLTTGVACLFELIY